jgi:hypothetical protein
MMYANRSSLTAIPMQTLMIQMSSRSHHDVLIRWQYKVDSLRRRDTKTMLVLTKYLEFDCRKAGKCYHHKNKG